MSHFCDNPQICRYSFLIPEVHFRQGIESVRRKQSYKKATVDVAAMMKSREYKDDVESSGMWNRLTDA